MESIVTTTSLAFTIPKRSRAASSIALGSLVNRWMSRCSAWFASRKPSISLCTFSRCADDEFSSALDRKIAVPHIAVVASTILVRITHEGIARTPLIAGRTNSRAVTAGLFKTPIGWAIMVGLLAARLSSHSVFPKLCKKHLQLKARDLSSGRLSIRCNASTNPTTLQRYTPRGQLSPQRDPRNIKSGAIHCVNPQPFSVAFAR